MAGFQRTQLEWLSGLWLLSAACGPLTPPNLVGSEQGDGGVSNGGGTNGSTAGNSGGATGANAGTGGSAGEQNGGSNNAQTGGGEGSGPGGSSTDADGGSVALLDSKCGVGFSALGNSVSSSICVRTQGGGAACSDGGNEKLTVITDAAGAALTDVRYATGGTNWQGALIARDDGSLWETQGSRLKTAPLIAQGVISASAGYHHGCALLEEGNGLDVVCWPAGASSVTRPALPDDLTIRQLSVTYDFACALTDEGKVWCWAEAGGSGNFTDIKATPAEVALEGPVVFMAAGQREVCGIRQDGTLTCVGNFAGGQFYSVPLRSDGSFDPSVYPSLVSVHLGQAQGCFIDATGHAECLGQEIGQKGRDGAPVAFGGATKVIGTAGNKGQACALTAQGELYCVRKEAPDEKRAVMPDGTPVIAEVGTCPL